MAYHYKANDEDEDFKDLDPAVAEDMAFAKALQNSLEVSPFPKAALTQPSIDRDGLEGPDG